MKYQTVASMCFALFGGAATVSASPLIMRGDSGFCPKGYSPTVITMSVPVTPTPTPSAVEETTSSTLSTPAPVIETPNTRSTQSETSVPTPVQIQTSTPAGDEALSTSSLAPTTEAPIPETTQAAVIVTTSSSKAPVVHAEAPTTSEVEQGTASQTIAAQSTKTASNSSSSSSSSSTSSSGGSSGSATFYGGNVAGGTCSFSGYTLPSGLFGTALSADSWDDAAKCGSCVAVTGPNGKTIKAMIVDQCPECATGHFDLFQDAFAELSAISAGVIDISYSYTSCDIDGPLKLKNKEGTSEYWFSMQVVNAGEEVTKLEVSTDGGSNWQSTTRTYYNYFENTSGFGQSSVDVRVTGKSGKTVIVKDVGCESGAEVTASSNL
ncbi:uncharacterized protein N7469_002678 [Penicillium citrinum]|uniref:Expansin-like EG45 domain-containing protein n=1 Tax=Penicillium citrinum TaxID=5077 RepID=A0A9W9TTX7_PENCI|nr:uncharacterized protein N7469_002678 [Penicillium citrinum]KAJ5241087.1 hypothetical protein N7469_002678 [Penicillium citrinum]